MSSDACVKFDFSGQTVVVTGGTRGIGRAVAESFLKAGATVIVTYAGNQSAAVEFVEANADYRDKIETHRFNVADYAEAEAFFRAIEERHPKIEVLVNNAGIRRDSVVGMMASEDWQAVLATNLTGSYNMAKLAVLKMMRARYGRIVSITSPSGKFGFEGQANYAASKAGQVALTRSLSKEVAKRGITVNCVSPGFIETDFIGDLPPEQVKAYKSGVPMKRFGKPEEVANCVLFLASGSAAYITGATLEVTGGL